MNFSLLAAIYFPGIFRSVYDEIIADDQTRADELFIQKL
jgi:hypothetical protein